jgi:3-hydroxyacyl-CoA dehydrogenase
VLGHHYFSPANVMKLLEIVRGRDTSKEVIATSLKLAKKLGKVGVVVGNCFGFVANRMLAYYMREAYLLLEEGASVPQIDKVLTDFGLPVGPYGMQDIAWHRRRRAYPAVSQVDWQVARRGPQSEIPESPVRDGTLRSRRPAPGGTNTTRPGSRNRTPDPLIDQMATKKRRSAASRDARSRMKRSWRESRRRLANEGARVLEEGYATRAGRHRYRLRLRLRVPAPARRADVLCRHRRSRDRARAREGVSRRGSATTGNRRRCSRSWPPKDAGSIQARPSACRPGA